MLLLRSLDAPGAQRPVDARTSPPEREVERLRVHARAVLVLMLFMGALRVGRGVCLGYRGVRRLWHRDDGRPPRRVRRWSRSR